MRPHRPKLPPLPSVSNRQKQDLSKPQQALVDLMHQLGFGTIHGLVVRDGNPVLSPPPRIFEEVKLDYDGPRSESPAGHNFVLRQEYVRLFARLDAVQNGEIERIDVQNGLPFRVNIAVTNIKTET